MRPVTGRTNFASAAKRSPCTWLTVIGSLRLFVGVCGPAVTDARVRVADPVAVAPCESGRRCDGGGSGRGDGHESARKDAPDRLPDLSPLHRTGAWSSGRAPP